MHRIRAFVVIAMGVLAASAPGQQSEDRQARDLPGDDVVVRLEPRSGTDGPRWSPKRATVPLTPSGDVLEGRIRLVAGNEIANPPIRVMIGPGAASCDRLAIDVNRDGEFIGAEEVVTCTPTARRGKVWSSWAASVDVATIAPDGSPIVTRYPLSLWYVVDPQDPDAEPALRWSRRGWMQGAAQVDGRTVHVALAESVMDGRYDRKDRWILADEAEGVRTTHYRSGDDHAWLGDDAWRLVSIHPSGRQVTLRRVDPGTTREKEERARDRHAADRAAPRADAPLAFSRDFAAAEARARRSAYDPMKRPLPESRRMQPRIVTTSPRWTWMAAALPAWVEAQDPGGRTGTSIVDR